MQVVKTKRNKNRDYINDFNFTKRQSLEVRACAKVHCFALKYNPRQKLIITVISRRQGKCILSSIFNFVRFSEQATEIYYTYQRQWCIKYIFKSKGGREHPCITFQVKILWVHFLMLVPFLLLLLFCYFFIFIFNYIINNYNKNCKKCYLKNISESTLKLWTMWKMYRANKKIHMLLQSLQLFSYSFIAVHSVLSEMI